MTEAETLAQMAADDAEQARRQQRLAAPGALGIAARWYAKRGLAVFPLVPGGKRPMTAHGLHDATTDLDAVQRWWLATPNANIGLRTGLRYDVIDVDGPAGYLSLDTLREAGLLPDILGTVVTPRGTHLYVAPSGDGNTAGLRPGIDYRGQSGYVVAPPSRREDGAAWAWAQPLELA